ncbi:hypothetical protein NC652_015870 [Populus alba x Populus x berolinensis]|nr:hypothetical protein NC652_015870 [Populus alba x Populus x berolinensis]
MPIYQSITRTNQQKKGKQTLLSIWSSDFTLEPYFHSRISRLHKFQNEQPFLSSKLK